METQRSGQAASSAGGRPELLLAEDEQVPGREAALEEAPARHAR